MRLFTREHVYKHDWETVTSAFWVKYPNELQSHVRAVDTINREVDLANARFRTRRLLSLEYSIPSWATTLLGISPHGYAIEEAVCDLQSRTLLLHSYNYTFSRVFRVHEYCTYTPHPQNETWTLYTQKASYCVLALGEWLGRKVESAAVATAADKSTTGLSAMQKIISRLEELGWKEERGYSQALDKAMMAVDKHRASLKFAYAAIEARLKHVLAAGYEQTVRQVEERLEDIQKVYKGLLEKQQQRQVKHEEQKEALRTYEAAVEKYRVALSDAVAALKATASGEADSLMKTYWDAKAQSFFHLSPKPSSPSSVADDDAAGGLHLCAPTECLLRQPTQSADSTQRDDDDLLACREGGQPFPCFLLLRQADRAARDSLFHWRRILRLPDALAACLKKLVPRYQTRNSTRSSRQASAAVDGRESPPPPYSAVKPCVLMSSLCEYSNDVDDNRRESYS